MSENFDEISRDIREGRNIYSKMMHTGTTTLEKNLVRLRSSVLQGRKQMAHSGLDAGSKNRMESAFFESVQQQARELIQAERDHVTKQLATMEAAAAIKERVNRADREAAADRLNRRLSAMSEQELRDQVLPAIGGEAELSPEQFDVLSANVKALDPSLHEQLREAGQKNDYYQPWRRTPEAREVLSWAAMLGQSDGSFVPIHFDGKATLVNLGTLLEVSSDER